MTHSCWSDPKDGAAVVEAGAGIAVLWRLRGGHAVGRCSRGALRGGQEQEQHGGQVKGGDHILSYHIMLRVVQNRIIRQSIPKR